MLRARQHILSLILCLSFFSLVGVFGAAHAVAGPCTTKMIPIGLLENGEDNLLLDGYPGHQ